MILLCSFGNIFIKGFRQRVKAWLGCIPIYIPYTRSYICIMDIIYIIIIIIIRYCTRIEADRCKIYRHKSCSVVSGNPEYNIAKGPGAIYCIIIIIIIIIIIYLTGRFFFHAIPTAMVRNCKIIIEIIMKKKNENCEK